MVFTRGNYQVINNECVIADSLASIVASVERVVRSGRRMKLWQICTEMIFIVVLLW